MNVRWILGGCLGLGIALLLMAVYLGVDLVETRQASIREAGAMARRQATNAAREIGSDLERQASLADQLAEEISSGRLSRYNRGLLGYRNGLMQKLLFFPLFLSGLLIITILHFY